MADQKPAQQTHAERALELAQSGENHRPDNEPTPNDGMVSTPRENYPPSGAFDAEGHEPALRRSRER
jgi:hypothetical protein